MTKYLIYLKKEIDNAMLSPVSKKVIKSTINNLLNFNEIEYQNPNNLIKVIRLYLKNNENVNSSFTFIAHIKSILKHTSLKDMLDENDKDEIHYHYKKMLKLKKKQDDNIEPLYKNKINYIPYNQLIKIYNDRKHLLSWKDKLIYGLYILQPPRKVNYGNVKFILNSDTEIMNNNDNYFILDQSKFIFNDYKKNEPYEFDANEDVFNLIYESIKLGLEEHDIVRDYLIINKFENNMLPNTLSKNITRISKILYNKNISINDIIISFCSRYDLEKTEEIKIDTLLDDSKLLGININTFIKKFGKNYINNK